MKIVGKDQLIMFPSLVHVKEIVKMKSESIKSFKLRNKSIHLSYPYFM